MRSPASSAKAMRQPRGAYRIQDTAVQTRRRRMTRITSTDPTSRYASASRAGGLVEEASASLGAAAAWDGLGAVLLLIELIVVGDLLAELDALLAVEDDALLAARDDDARVAIGLAAVVGIAREPAIPRRVDK